MGHAKGVGNSLIKIVIFVFFLMGCARVSIESKKPIKVDVTMRLDIYQHVTQDVNAIEDMISSPKQKKGAASNKSSFLRFGVDEAYAQEESDYSPEVKKAIERRKTRRENLMPWQAKGVIGENSQGLVEIRDTASGGYEAVTLVETENKDRMTIYQYVAQRNGASLGETAKIFAKRIQEDAPSGTPIQSSDGQWKTK